MLGGPRQSLFAPLQIFEYEKKLPDSLIACIGGGSNSLGLFHNFLDEC